MSIESLQARLDEIEVKRKKLTDQMGVLRAKELLGLPAKAGFATIDELIVALAVHATPPLRSRIRSADPGLRGLGNSSEGASRRRRHIPAHVKAQIKNELMRENVTVAVLAEKYRTSPASIMKWKREWGLTRTGRESSSNQSNGSAQK